LYFVNNVFNENYSCLYKKYCVSLSECLIIYMVTAMYGK